MPRHARPLMEQAYEELKRRIISLDLRPGERLDDLQLSTELAISRTPVREALFRLSAEGLVTIPGKWGFAVQTLDLAIIADTFEAHTMLAKTVALLAAHRATAGDIDAMQEAAADVEAAIERRDYLQVTSHNAVLHRREATAAHSSKIQEMTAAVIDQEQRLAYMCFGGSRNWAGLDEHFTEVTRHHAALIAAYREHDPAAAQRVATEHVRLFQGRVQTYLDTEIVGDLEITATDLPAAIHS
jgi:DNA-binding GntR family transcriptional regulator